MYDQEKSLYLFEQAHKAKRSGDYHRAISLYKQSIQTYPDDPQLANALISLGKSYYLNKDYKKASNCYIASILLNVLKEPGILQDYECMQSGKNRGSYEFQIMMMRFTSFFGNTVRHLAHASKDGSAFRKKAEVQIYESQIQGSNPIPDTEASKRYDEECRNEGFDMLENALIMCQKKSRLELKEDVEYIISELIR